MLDYRHTEWLTSITPPGDNRPETSYVERTKPWLTVSKKTIFFKIDPECHLVGDMAPLSHFPGVQMWWKAAQGITRAFHTGMPDAFMESLEPHEKEKNPDPEFLLSVMDKYGVDIACLLPESMMETTGYSRRWYTNEDMAQVVETHPDRFIYEPNLSPIKFKGVKKHHLGA